MTSIDHGHDGSTSSHPATGIVDISEMTARELRNFVESTRGIEGEVRIQRRGQDAFLLAE